MEDVYRLILFLLWIQLSCSREYIDASTKVKSKIRQKDGKRLQLVMSDEFNEEGRNFASSNDPFFEAVEKPDNTNEAIQFYNSSNEYVTTKDGCLEITARAVKTSWIDWDSNRQGQVTYTKNYTSGMIQTWNKFCFTGGVLELSIDLPGDAYSGGLWPAAWLAGNLARVTFPQSTMHVWPWSYDRCGELDHLNTKQEINACLEDPGFGLHPKQGRGSPEIDIFEVMPGHEMPGHKENIKPFMSNSLQISPGIPKGPLRPKNGIPLNSSQTWYNGLIMSDHSEYNYGFWGQECGPEKDDTDEQIYKYMEDAISVNTLLNQSHFNSQHVYKIEWQPGLNGYLYWYLDNEIVFGIDGHGLHNLTGALIPVEPMYIILNIAISHRWGMPEPCPIDKCPVCWRCYDCLNPDCQCTLPEGMKGCKNFPATMKIDYIRLYQDVDDPSHTLGCSPPGYPTAEFIEAHKDRYADWKPFESSTVTATENFTVQVVHIISLISNQIVDHIGFFVVIGLVILQSVWRKCFPRITSRRAEYIPIDSNDNL